MRGITRAALVVALAATAAGVYDLQGNALSDAYHPAATTSSAVTSAAVMPASPRAVPRIVRRTAIPHPAPTVSHRPPGEPPLRRDLTGPGKNAVAAIRQVDPQADAGIEIVDRKSGATFGYHQNAQFYSASLVKLLIAMDALDRPGPPRPELDAQVRRLLSYSDDPIANQLWVADGGPAIVSREIARVGLRETVPPTNPGMWGATLFTANDVARIYEYLLDEFPARDRAVMLAALRHSAPDGSDGFYQHFGIPDGLAGTPWAVKQGWMSYHSHVELHTSGLVGAGDRYIVVILTGYPAGTPWDTARSAVTAGARALAPALAG